MPRYKVTLEYDGTGLVGWQRQDNGPSAQQFLEEAIEKFSGEKSTSFAAGRTDAGVHARGQVAHFDLTKDFPEKEIRDAINFHIKPANIAVLEAEKTGPEFHARFDAKKRHYRYRIVSRISPPIIDRFYAWHIKENLDSGAMHEAAQVLVGHHDFTSFRATECQAKSPIKTIDSITITRAGEEITMDVSATSFLHHMIRNFAGTLREVGRGKWGAEDVAKALAAKNRSAAGPTAPPHGLYFMRVDY